MPLSIKDPEVDLLARQAASQTGKTITDAVLEALRSYLNSLSRQQDETVLMVADAMAIGRHCAALPTIDNRSDEDILGYNSDGVPGQ